MAPSFDHKLNCMDSPESCAILDVWDFADAMRLLLEEWGMEDPALLLGLTRLALERLDANNAPSFRHGRNYEDPR